MLHVKDTTASRPPFMAFANGAEDLSTLKTYAGSQQWPESCIMQGDITTATQYLKAHPSPVVLLVELSSATTASQELDTLADVCDPDTKVIAIGSVNEYSFYCWLMDIGISSYLLRPLTQATLESAYQKTIGAAQAQATTERKPGTVIAIMGARGGVGATTLGLNLAGIIAEYSTKKIVLVDMDLHEGTVALTLDIEPSRGIRDALEKPDRIDSLFIERVMSKPHKNLAVISAEESLQDTMQISEYAADAFLKELCDKFDVVIVDVPRYLNAFTRQILKKSDQALLVAELTLASLRDTLRMTDVMRDTIKIKAPQVIINRVGLAAKQEMSLADFEKGTNLKVAQKISFLPDIFMPISSEISSITNRKHAGIKPLYELASQLLPDLAMNEEVKQNPLLDILKKKPKKEG